MESYESPALKVLREIAARPDDTTADQLVRLVEALRPSNARDVANAVARFEAFVALLERDSTLAVSLGRHLRAVLGNRAHRTLLAESGILTSAGFLTGLWSRLLGRLLPPATDPNFARDLVVEIFDEPHDGEWVAAIPRDRWLALLDSVGAFGADFAEQRQHMHHELLEAIRLTSHQLAALGSEAALLRYVPALAKDESPFFAQCDAVTALLGAPDTAPARTQDIDRLLESCLGVVHRVRDQAHELGVGVNLVFILARIEQLVARQRELLLLARPSDESDRQLARVRAVELLITLIRAENRRYRISDLFDGTTTLLARRVTEHASRSGEHYAASTRAEYRQMARAAAGAGLIVGVMALLKILTASLGLPGFWQAVGFSLIYGLGFVVVHLLHLTIATKQPAMTAATLAAVLDGTSDRETRLERLTSLAAQVSRTQWVSIAGNVVIGFLTALAIGLVGKVFFDLEPISLEKAERLLHELHPWKSLALLHAGIAGIYLFLSGLISGYYDNQALYHRIPQRLRRVKWMKRILGPRRLDRFAGYIEHNLGALVGNFIFGCMLGSTGTVGAFFGLPVDIRHVSFASANLAYGLQALDFDVAWPIIVASAAGVLLIGMVNLAVSFWLALRVAVRSRGIRPEETDGLARRVFARMRKSPREFFLAPRA